MTDWVPVVDISRHQGSTNFHVMRSKGVRGLILRVSHGLALDSRYEEYYHDAIAAGFAPEDVGHYSFLNPKRSSGADAAEFAVEHIMRISGQLDFLYMLDVENYKNESPDIGNAPVFGPQFADHIREHIATVKALSPKSRVIGYTNRAYWNGKIYKGSVIEWVGDDALAAELDWIVARYPVYSLAGYASKPLPPDTRGWDEWAFKAAPDGPFPPRGADWEAWQFSAGYNRQGQAYGCSSSDLDLNIVHPDAWARWTAQAVFPPPVPPNPQPEDDTLDIRLLTLADSPAQFLADVTAAGAARRCEWTGDGGDPKTRARVKHFRDAFVATPGAPTFELSTVTAELIYISLDGPLPPGFTAALFANTAEIESGGGTVDVEARAAFERQDGLIVKLNDAVGRNGQEIHEVRVGLGKLAPT